MDTIAKRMKHYRKEKNLTVSETARMVGVADSTYRDWENGRMIQGEPYLQICRALNISLSQLLSDDVENDGHVISTIDEIINRLNDLRTKV